MSILTESRYEKIGSDTYVRIDEKTGEKVGYAIFNVQKDTAIKSLDVEIPFSVLKLLKQKAEKSQLN